MASEDKKKELRKMLSSMDVAQEKRAQMKKIFPEVFSEDKIDFDELKRVLGEWVEPSNERFGLNWAGKAECMKIIQQPSIATLKPVREESVNFDETQNLFLEGDNLEILKLLQRSYSGKVKMIYIDPPYNTGNEFIYPDNYKEELKTYLHYSKQLDENGYRFSTNTEREGRFHSNWLKMMHPRLYLAKNLLREDGVIFISINDSEQSNLKALCDIIFGEENFVAQIIWQGLDTIKNDAQHFSDNHQYIVCYGKNKSELELKGVKRTKKQKEVYKNADNDPRGSYLLTPLHAKSGTASSIYTFTFKNGVKWSPPKGTYPRFSEETLKEMEEDGRLYFGKNNGGIPQKKTYLSEVSEFVTLTTFWDYHFAGSTRQSNSDIEKILSKGVFENSKPQTLLSILSQSIMQDNDIALDFFAGSCTTAHAVMALNAEDGGNRQFIMVQLPEHIDPKKSKEAYDFCVQLGKPPTVAEIGKERVRRAGKKIMDEHEDKLGLNGDLELDVGFKVFKLTPSNFKVWEGTVGTVAELEKQLEAHINHIDKNSSDEDILYELITKEGEMLATAITKRAIANKNVYSINDGAMFICLDKNITQELLDALAAEKPKHVIMLDEGFNKNDQLKTNAVHTFEPHQIIFITV